MDLSIAAEIYGKYGVTGVFVLLGVWLIVDSRNQQKLFTSLIVEKLDEVRMAV